MEMEEDNLPVKYLGVPLTSRKFMKEDYWAMIDQVCGKIDGWQVRHLSLAGRAQLIRSSLYSIIHFWSAIFPIPKYVVEEVEKKIRTFLWAGKGEGEYFAKVAWNTLCLPMEEGGLGFKNISCWNQVCLAKLVWDVAQKKDILWVKWVHEVRLKGTSIWYIKKRQKDPWYWKKMLAVRHLVEQRYVVHVGNGKQISFWFDNWSRLGPLWKFLSDREKESIPVGINTCLADVRRLNLPGKRRHTRRIEELVNETNKTIAGLQNEPDTWKWKEGKFAYCLLWEEIRNKEDVKPWTKMIWNRCGIPKMSFIAWMLFHGKLATKDRIISWGVNAEPKCAYCNENESIDHLFFRCPFSGQVWRLLLMKMEAYRSVQNWTEERSWCINNLAGKSFKSKVHQLAFISTVYVIWRERNDRIFGDKQSTVEQCYHRVLAIVSARASSWRRQKRTHKNWKCAIEWSIEHDVFSS